jgi:hypothetical protein
MTWRTLQGSCLLVSTVKHGQTCSIGSSSLQVLLLAELVVQLLPSGMRNMVGGAGWWGVFRGCLFDGPMAPCAHHSVGRWEGHTKVQDAI